MRSLLSLLALVLFCTSTGCSAARGAYYDAWESFGYAKRERLVDNVKAARQEQVEAKEQFASALEQFKSVVNFQGGDLEKMYGQLDEEYEDAANQAEEVKEKIAAVKNVSSALFSEWEGEIEEIEGDPSLQSQSRELYAQTQESYEEMIRRMDAAAGTMEPVLQKFKNRVLFLKHNLNARAIASLKGTELELGGDIEKLIREMEASIAQADAFIDEVQGE